MEQATLEQWREAGKLTSLIRNHGKQLIKKGASMRAVCDELDNLCVKHGVVPAFPAQISCDDTAAHFCVDDKDIIFDKQLAKLDCGANVNGFLGDSAVTVDLSGSNTLLVKAVDDALAEGIKVVRAGATISSISKTIQDVIEGYGVKPVVNLSGHGVAPFELHTKPTIPNIDTKDMTTLQQDQIIAIEPFATDGIGQVSERGTATVFMQTAQKPLRDMNSRKVMAAIMEYQGVPFAKRHLASKVVSVPLNLILKKLVQMGVLEAFPPLVEKSNGLVSQAEHTLLVTEDGCEVLTK